MENSQNQTIPKTQNVPFIPSKLFLTEAKQEVYIPVTFI